VPDINEVLLELINIVHTAFIHSLHNTPELIIIHRNQVWAVWWLEIRTNEIQRFLL